MESARPANRERAQFNWATLQAGPRVIPGYPVESFLLTMRIGIDYLPAVCHAPGIGRYGRELVRALVRLPDAPELRLFEIGGGARTMASDLGLEGSSVRRFRARLPRRLVRSIHTHFGWGADRWLGGVDVFHRMLPDYPPVSGAAEVLPVAELPSPGTPADADLARALQRSAAAIVFCRHYASQLPERYGIDPARVHQVPVGCEHWARNRPSAHAEAPASSASPARILVLGAIRNERSPLTVLRAFELFGASERDCELVFIGRPGSATSAFEAGLAKSPVRGRVTWIRNPVEADMPRVMGSAALLVHLAMEEGTPVTPLEAFAAGVPVVASRLPAFEEALGDVAAYVDRSDEPDPGSLAQAIGAALSARGEADAGTAAASRRATARPFTWQANARATLGIWDGLSGE